MPKKRKQELNVLIDQDEDKPTSNVVEHLEKPQRKIKNLKHLYQKQSDSNASGSSQDEIAETKEGKERMPKRRKQEFKLLVDLDEMKPIVVAKQVEKVGIEFECTKSKTNELSII